MKKSKKQRKLETAKRLAKEAQQNRKPVERNYIIKDETIKVDTPRVKTKKLPELYIVLPAVKDDETGEIFIKAYSPGHQDIIHTNKLTGKKLVMGFVDNYHNFHDRFGAAEIAYKAGQCSDIWRANGLLSTSYNYIGDFSDNFSENNC